MQLFSQSWSHVDIIVAGMDLFARVSISKSFFPSLACQSPSERHLAT